MKSLRLIYFGLLFCCISCASVAETVVWWSRESEVKNSQELATKMGMVIEQEAYQETLRLWPSISTHGLQRRALLYTLIKSQGKSLESWRQLSSDENFDRELAQIEKLRHRNAF